MSRARYLDHPLKTDPAEFGGGRVRGLFKFKVLEKRLCSARGCGRHASAAWSACCDGNIQRPLCLEHDVVMNMIAMRSTGDPEGPAKLKAYVERLEREHGRTLELDGMRPDVTYYLAYAR